MEVKLPPWFRDVLAQRFGFGPGLRKAVFDDIADTGEAPSSSTGRWRIRRSVFNTISEETECRQAIHIM